MFFIYLFFGIGVLATILGLIPAILEIYCYLYSLFINLKTEKDNKKEIRKAKLDKKKQEKIAKIDSRKDLPCDCVIIPEEIKEEVTEQEEQVVEEVKDTQNIEDVTPVEESVVTNEETIATNDTPVAE